MSPGQERDMSDSATGSATETATMNGRHTASTSLVAATDGAQPNDAEFDATVALLRLLVGGMLVGSDELRYRLERWQETARTAETVPSQTTSDSLDSLRYTFVGLLFEAEARARRRFSTVLERISRFADEANLFYTTRAPAMRRTPFDPFRQRLDELIFLASDMLDRWADRGRTEEQYGRRMARRAAGDVIDELLDYMARNPQVRALIEQQGMDMAGSAVDEVRERTASADLWIERLAHSLLRRPTGERVPKPTGTPEASAPAAEAPTSPIAPSTPTAPSAPMASTVTKPLADVPDAQGATVRASASTP